MKIANYFFLTVTAAMISAIPLYADTIVLKNGSRLNASVLKSNDHIVAVDLGYTVITLPKDQILRIDTESADAPQNNSQQKQPPTSDQTPDTNQSNPWQIYRTADLSPATIEKNVERYSEAVVMVTSPGGLGSGFIISPDGYLITNYHVIERETKIKVTVFRSTEQGFEQKQFSKVKIIALNPYVDLALLKIEDTDESFKFVYLGSMAQIETGNEVFAIGNPLGLTRTVSQGIVSAKNRNFEGRLYIQTTTDINPGNSGGPLFDLKGQVIGVTSMGYLFLGGLNFAIPVDVVKRFIDNRDAFAYDQDNPNTGFRYLQPAERKNKNTPPVPAFPF